MYEVWVRPKPLELKGIEAINWLRARRLNERTELKLTGEFSLQKIGVSPAFARIWFPPGVFQHVVVVDLNEYGYEEIVEKRQGGLMADLDYAYYDVSFKLRLKTEQAQWLVIRDYIDRTSGRPR